MGLKGELGVIAEGALADLLLVDGDPLKDQSVLVGPDRFVMIMKDGKMHRDPRRLARRAATHRGGMSAVSAARAGDGAASRKPSPACRRSTE